MKRSAKIIILTLITATAIGGGYFFWWRESPLSYETTTVEPTTVRQDIEFSGEVVSALSIDLGFTTGGQLKSISEIGEEVQEGHIIAQLDSTAERLEQARAVAEKTSTIEQGQLTFNTATEQLARLQAENKRLLEVKRQTVRNNKQDLDSLKEIWQQVVRESGDQSSIAQKQYNLVIAAQNAYDLSQDDLAQTLQTTAKTEAAAQNAAREAKAVYLATLQASGTHVGLSSLAANEALAQEKLADRILRAPFTGTITQTVVKASEFVTAGSVVLTLATLDDLQIEAQVSEADRVEIRPGMTASITFDAYPNQTISGAVKTIEPASVLVEGVPTYKVTLSVSPSESLTLFTGLTADITVHAQEKTDVVAVPRRAVISRGSEQIVQVLKSDQTIEERVVKTGLAGTDGLIEINQGLKPGEQVIIRQNP